LPSPSPLPMPVAAPLPVPIIIESIPEPIPVLEIERSEVPIAAAIQPIPGEMLSEERQPAPPIEDYDRRGERDRDRDRGRPGRRDRDRRGPKKPKIPSFENKSYDREPRPDDRAYSSRLEVLPGESLAKVSQRTEPEAEPELDRNAPLGAVAEEQPVMLQTETEKEREIETERASTAPPSVEIQEPEKESGP